ncbi:MAG: HAMP domain-containing protein, partial [Solirubrobacterales bacterium]
MNDRKFRWGIREKLTLLFFGVTLIAVSVNFLMVVPRLEQRLRNDRVDAMEQIAGRFNAGFANAATVSDQSLNVPDIWVEEVSKVSATVGTRVAILRSVEDRRTLFDPRFTVFVDPSGETQQGKPFDDTIAAEALRTGQVASGVSNFGATGLHAEAASPLIVNGNPVGAVVYTTSLSGVTEIVRQQARRNIVAGVFALVIALIAGLLASSYMARRLRRLELAARAVANGNFAEPLVVDANDEIGEVARAFNTMQDRLGQADRARK